MQTSFTEVPTVSQPGQVIEKEFGVSRVSGETSAGIPFGRMVQVVSDQFKLLTGATNVLGGIVEHDHSFDRLNQLDSNGDIKPGVLLSTMLKGAMMIQVEEAVSAFVDRPHFRHTAGSGGTRIGGARKSAVAGETIDCSNQGVFVTSAGIDGYAMLLMDLAADKSTSTAEIAAGALSADATGRAIFASDFFDAATVLAKFATDSFDNAELLKLVKDGAFAASDATRALFGSQVFRMAQLGIAVSNEITANGSAQNYAHGLGVAPAKVIVIPTDTAPSTAGVFTVTEGSHDSTNAVVTVTSGKKYKVLVFA